jgi:hypothetical protein
LLLFGRTKTTRPRRDKVLLFNLATSQTTTLASVDDLSLTPGEVRGNYATWDRCTTICNAFVHDIATGTTTRLARPDTTSPRHQYAPAATPTGTVYVFRSRDACGAGVQLVRYGPDDGPTGLVVASLPSGRDGWQTSVRPAADGSVDVFYQRVNCSTGSGDIYKVTDPG